MCGIFGIVSNKEVVPKIVLGLYDLQPRGEQACGVATSTGIEFSEHRDAGLVTEVFNKKNREDLLENSEETLELAILCILLLEGSEKKNNQKCFSH